jgi:hypothetical protein
MGDSTVPDESTLRLIFPMRFGENGINVPVDLLSAFSIKVRPPWNQGLAFVVRQTQHHSL